MTIRHFTASAVVLGDEDRGLLDRHNKIGLWLYPGGHVDLNESPAEAAVREVFEETGVQAVVLGEPAFAHAAVRSHAAPWTVIEMDVTDSRDGRHRHLDFVYVCRAAGGDLTAQQEEVAGVQWVAAAELARLPTPVELPELVAAAALWANKASAGW
jgi:8-oxo-dGTP pyrophosphatase MutT (NUDIX family)